MLGHLFVSIEINDTKKKTVFGIINREKYNIDFFHPELIHTMTNLRTNLFRQKKENLIRDKN